jgi:hypothetical protein
MRPLLILIALASGVTAASADAASGRACGLTPRVDGARYDVREIRGTVPCKTVKRVVTNYLRDGTVASHWTCFRGHDSAPWAVSCARGTKVLVRVYAPT